MDATALVRSDLAIQVHAASAIAAFLLGTLVLLLPKGTAPHKAMGRVWILLMLVVALSSFVITEIRMFGPYSLIHALSVFTLFGLASGYWSARRGHIAAHRATMISLYGGALILAGAFTLVPGRRMHAVLFADGGQSAALLALGFAAIVGAILLARFARRAFPE